MERIPEPELMTEDEQVRAYASGDFEAPQPFSLANCDELSKRHAGVTRSPRKRRRF